MSWGEGVKAGDHTGEPAICRPKPAIYLDVTSSCKSPVNTGVQRAVRGIFRSLSQAGAPVTPLAWDPGLAAYCALSERERGFLEAPFRLLGRPEAVPGRHANPAGVFSKLARALRRRRSRVALDAGCTLFVPEIFQDNRAAFFGTFPGRKVAVCHDLIAWRRPEITPVANQQGVREYLAALGQMTAVIAVSEETRAELLAFWREAGQDPAPVTVLGWPVDHSGEARPRTPAPMAARVLCVGTFEPRKNHLALLEAARQLWERGAVFELTLIGRTTPVHGPLVVKAIETLAAANHPVRWLRHVDDRTLQEAYEGALFTVFPSLAEGFGLPVIESLWHGRPCLCGANGALGEISAGGGCLSVDQTQPAALAAAMERLLNDPPLRARLAEEARARPFATWDAYAPAVLSVL